MADIRTNSEEREYLSRLIADWNASRLDIFAISEPNEDLEYRGVMRFFFQDYGSKVATKCARFTNRDNTETVTKRLVDKFHPDMKMLSNPTYSLYEVHPNGDARKLRLDEHPLQIQLEWQLDDREGRFLLKSDSDKIVHSNLFDVKSSDKNVQQATVGQNLKRRLSKREKKQLKKQKEEAKKAAEKAGKDDTQIAQHLYDELPETSFTRSISNPEAVMRRRRQQKLEKRLKDFQSKDSPAGGTLKIFATTLKPEIPYKTLLLSVDDTTAHVINEALIKYQMEKEDPEEYCLVMVNIPAEGSNTSATVGKERVVHDDDCPLKIAVTWPSNRGTVVFHLRRRANLPQHRRDKRRSKSPVRKPMDLTPDKTVAERLAKPAYPDHLLPYLLELSSDGNDLDYKPRLHRLQMNATEVGSEKTFASGGNFLQLHAPHILPRHCVITNMDGRVSVTPSSGDAEVLVNGKRIYETTQLQHGDVVKIGRVHTFRFCDPAYEKPQRYSAPAAGDTSSISSSSDIDVQRKQRPQSLGSALPSHYSNSYPSNYIDDHVDIDTNAHPEGMFETTFDVSGEVLTYTGGHMETEPYTYSRPPDSPTKTSFSNAEDLYDDKLPATLEFRENGEDAFFAAVISEVNGLAVHFKLAPTYTLYMCSRYRLSPHYRSDLMEHQRGERLGVTILKIANMARSTIRENAEMPGSLAFWMANCSELLHFIKEDIDISPYTKDGQQVLAQSVQLAFRHLVLCVQHELRTSMSAFLDPTDEADMEDSDLDSMNDSDHDHIGLPSDGRSFRVQNKYGQDGRPLSGADSWFGGRRLHGRATVSEVIYNLTSTMSLLRRCRVNAALTIQVFSQLFHFINMWLFNKLVLEPKLDLCTREWGRRISKRLARVEKWAEKQGLELAADCHLCRIAQAAHLLQAPKNTSADINAISSSCFKLNSLQMRTLLENYRPAPDEYLSQEHIERLVNTAEEKADEVARSNGQEVQREEETELQLPFLLPEDGYSCDVIRGVPPGLQSFLEPLANTGLCRLTIQPETSGLWTVYQRKHVESSVDVPSTITPDVQEITINKGRGGMGLSIVAAKGIRQDKLGIYIKQVVKDGPASKDGRLQAGDQILSVDGESLVGVTQEKAAEVMKKSGSIVSLKIVKQGAIYHGLATMLIQQSPNRETAPVPRKLTPVEPEPEPMQLSPTLPENDIRSPGRWLPDSTRQREEEESMREESWRQKEEDRRAKGEEERMFEERMRREDEERRRREDEERRRREEEDRIRQEEEEERIREEEEERIRLEEEERIRREEEDRLYEERLRKEEEKRLNEERLRREEEDKRALRLRQEKQEEERKRREAEEDERFRIQEERIRKRMEEERRIIEEERRKLAEERRLLDEERKKEAERKRTEEQRLIEEERRLAEEKQLIEEERRRVLNQKKAEDETRRLEEERIALIAQRRRVEEERELAEERRREEMEEQRREEMEEMRRREEIRKREEFRRMEDQRRLAEERKRSEEEARLRPMETKQRTRRIRFEDEVMAAENAFKVETVQQTQSSPQPVETKPEKEIIKPTLKASVEAEKPEITGINKKPKNEYYEEEPVVVRGKLTEEDISIMDALFEKLDEEQQQQQVRPNSLNINRPVNKQPIIEEPPTSPIRVDSRDTRFGRAIVIKQGMLPSARSPSSQNQANFDYESVAQNLKAIDQSRRQKQDINNGDEFERWQKRQREIAEQREREAEERDRLARGQEEVRQREQREQREREQREQREREQREQREREQREQREREQREQREREQREREQREREQREREEREHEQRERERREQWEREQRERELRDREQWEREQREREQHEREEREREQREREQREQRERERQEEEQREELERQRLEKERLERDRKEYLEQQRKEQEDKEKGEAEKKKQKEAEERRRFVERERKMLASTSKGSRETLDYIEAMNEEEVEREFQRRLEAEKKRSNLGSSYEDRRAGGLVSVTRVTYHPERNDQSERDRKLQMIIQERKELEREKKETERRVVFEGEREKQKELQRRQQEENERQQESWLRQQRDKHEQARREQGRLRLDKKSQEDDDIIKKRSELQQRREQEDVVRMNLQRVREDAERAMNEVHKQQRLEQQRELQRKLEEQKILIEKESEARRQLQEEQRTRSARGSTGEPDHVIELKERALKDYERRRMLIDQEINRQRADGLAQEQLRQTAMEDMKTKFDQQQQPKPVSVLKTSNGNKRKKQVSFSNMSTEFHEPASPTYVVESSSGYTAKITPAASVRLVQTRPPADSDSPPIPRPPPPEDDDYDDYDPPPLPPPPPPEELLDDNQFPPLPRALFNDRSSSSSSSNDPRSPIDHNSRDYSDVFPADYPYPPNSHQFKNTVSSYGTYPRGTRPVSYPTPADLDSLQFTDSVRYGGSNNNISGFNSSSGIRETQSLGRINSTDASAIEANRIRMGRISLTDDTRKEPPPVAKKPEKLGFKEKMKMFNQDGTPKSRVTVSRWEREQMDVNGDVSYA